MLHTWLTTAKEDVSNFVLYAPHLIHCFHQLTLLFTGGQISQHFAQWRQLISDPFILELVQGARLNFIQHPVQLHASPNPPFSASDNAWICLEIPKLLKKGILSLSRHDEGEFISPIFLVDKRDGGKRLILNLKKLNEYIEYHHFKMHGIKHILKLVTLDCYMAVLDIKDAYYSVPIHPVFQKYLKFTWNGM